MPRYVQSTPLEKNYVAQNAAERPSFMGSLSTLTGPRGGYVHVLAKLQKYWVNSLLLGFH